VTHRVIFGDCLDALRDLARDSVLVDAVVTDPPYHLASIVARLGAPDAAPIQSGPTGVYARSSTGFMGQQWDGGDVAFRPETWRRVYDVMKPGAHLVAFAATKGYHRMACAIEDAGFEIRDMLAWLYGTGFPKSHKMGKDLKGWGTAIKPAIEPIVFAQKPISEDSIAANMARWGVGAINIDASRIPVGEAERFDGGGQSRNGVNVSTHADGWRRPWMDDPEAVEAHRDRLREGAATAKKLGRFPANVLHDGSEEVLAAFAEYGERGAVAPVTVRKADKFRNVYNGSFVGNVDEAGSTFQGDSGTAARFFYSSKATQGERIFECNECGEHTIGKPECGHDKLRTHPTVKPISLMSWLVSLICPVGGLVLDPFAGTGTTAAAARASGMQSLSIEADENHVRDIGVRLGISVEDLIAAKVAAVAVNTDQLDMFA
jgi:site-specific DNA-methyltransferase (adenine-specific)